MTAGPVLHVERLSVEYAPDVQALSDVSFAVPAGGKVGLIGPNGAGKTSLLLAVMRGVRYAGRIVVDGVELTARSEDQARSRCGMTFQDADDQLFMPTLLDDVAFGPLNQRLSPAQAEQRARAAIAAVGLETLEQRSAHHLSAGQKRLASLATILSMQVRLLLLDEPGANLDVRSRRRLIELLRQRPEAMLLASHDLDMIRQLCSQIILLDAGRLVASGPADGILGDARLLAGHGLA
jgi:cobalt/nickel transport system ATP-binding protein